MRYWLTQALWLAEQLVYGAFVAMVVLSFKGY